MDLNHIALWLAALSALSLFWRTLRAPNRPLGWLVVTVFVLLVAACGWFWFPKSAGYVAGALTFAFILAPIWTHNAATRANARLQYRRARQLFGIAACLHPLDDWPTTPRLIRAFELAHDGRTREADALLRDLAGGTGNLAATANAQRLHMLGRWRELKAFVERGGLLAVGRQQLLLAYYLRALGELGEIDRLAEFMRAQERTLRATGSLELGQLCLFAFTGQVELTRQALGGKRQTYSDDTRDFWLAIASEHAGQREQARQVFERLRHSSHAQIRERAEIHIANLARAGALEPASEATLRIVQRFAHQLTERQNLALNAPREPSERRMVQALLLLNGLVYVAGSYPGFVDTRPSFGERWAFYAPDILTGEWWRVLSYLFVHANIVHLLMNLAGLWVLGPFVERAFGRLRFSVIYLIAGCTGSSIYLTFTWYGWIEPEQLVGASGCIMGLLGATAAVMLRAWWTQRATIARQIFFRLLAVMALQVAFDQSTPQIAGLAHALGLLGGFAAGLVLREGVSPKRSVAVVQ